MPPRPLRLAGLLLVFLLSGRFAGAAELERRTWTVDGVEREALAWIPLAASTTPAPLVFVFHGHGGTMRFAAARMALHQAWPEAIVVYPQGLPTPGALTDPDGKRAGWQKDAGNMEDRDLRFFDTMLADLQRRCRVDSKRIYATGHSNGGGFTYLLWAERGPVFAAFAPSAALLARGYERAQPKPLLHLGSPSDPLVRFAWQEMMIDQVLRLNGCGPRRPEAMGLTVYPSRKGADVATYLHDGGHVYPAEAGPRIIAKFFQDHPKP